MPVGDEACWDPALDAGALASYPIASLWLGLLTPAAEIFPQTSLWLLFSTLTPHSASSLRDAIVKKKKPRLLDAPTGRRAGAARLCGRRNAADKAPFISRAILNKVHVMGTGSPTHCGAALTAWASELMHCETRPEYPTVITFIMPNPAHGATVY